MEGRYLMEPLSLMNAFIQDGEKDYLGFNVNWTLKTHMIELIGFFAICSPKNELWSQTEKLD